MATNPTESHHELVVSTPENGYGLSMIDGNRYTVETTRFDNRPSWFENGTESTSDTFEDGEAYDHAKELYPWASDRPYF